MAAPSKLVDAVGTLHGKLVFGRRVARLGRAIAAFVPPGSRTLLDVGAGSGDVAAFVTSSIRDLDATGVDVLVRPDPRIPVGAFDGVHVPRADASVDVVLLVDVLHHAAQPEALLAECARVAARRVIVKDHIQRNAWDRLTLRFMDWVGNSPHGVRLEYRYFDDAAWSRALEGARLREEERSDRIGLYPFPASLVFERHLHFVAALAPKR